MKLNAWMMATGLLLGGAACDSGDDAPPTAVEMHLYTAPGDANPYENVGFLRFVLTGDGLERPIEQLVKYVPGGSASIDGAEFSQGGEKRQLTVEGWSSGPDNQPRNLLARGRSLPVEVVSGQAPLGFDILFSRVNHFLPLVSADDLAAQNLAQVRVGHTATRTETGEIVIAGGGIVSRADAEWWKGAGFDQLTTSVEALNQFAQRVATRAPMIAPRAWHTATSIGAGQVVIAGGYGTVGTPLASVELYNPPDVLTGTAVELAPMAVPRAGHTATLLDRDSRLMLFVGGDDQGTWELWDPVTGTRGAVPLPDGKQRRYACATTFYLAGRTEPAVLISGGESDTAVHATAMLFDSVAQQMLPVSEAMPGGARTQHTATYIQSRGFIYIAGGYTDLGRQSATGRIDVFQVDQQRFIQGNDSFQMRTARGGHAAALMPNNTVVITGGGGAEPAGGAASPLRSIEVIFEFVDVTRNELRIEVASSFDPGASTSAVPYMPTERLGHRAIALDNGMTLLVGGMTANGGGGGYSMVPALTVYNPAQ